MVNDRRIVWQPQPKQRAFMRRGEYEAFYGGAAGGGKSDALVMEALRQVHVPNYKGLILRKTYPMLRELIQKSQLYYPQAFPKARYNGTEHYWTFPSGAKILFGNVKSTTYQGDYQGQQYDFIGFDELTHFTWDEYSYFFSRNRASGAGTVCYVRATGNPGGIGHGWVKERFISAAPPGTKIVGEVNVDAPDGRKLTYKKSRIFIPSSVFDNPRLIANNPSYLSALASLPYAQKQALLYGNWDSFVGQVFMEWTNDPTHYQDGTNTHVIDPFPIPRHWQIVRSFDWGHARPFSVGWFAVDEDGRMYMIQNEGGKTEEEKSMRTIRRGDKGLEVGALQKRLVELGNDLDIDGVFGQKTENALRMFQASNGLTADGICGAKTWAALGVAQDTAGTAEERLTALEERVRALEDAVTALKARLDTPEEGA